jgi:two-component system, NtrC family, response regulator AtoC
MRILVVDDEPGLRQTLSVILGGEGYEVTTAANGAEALEVLERLDADLVLCDLRMPGTDGMAVLDAHRARGGRALVIVMSAYLDDDRAVEAMRRGAYDVIPKPFRADQVLLIVRKAVERERLRQEVAALKEELNAARGDDAGIVGRSDAVRAMLEVARKVARHPSTVLVTGESGTGKELVARLVHRASPRAERAFVAVNCAAIPEALLESELFGHERGAFTGATADRAGLFEEANGGTLFLDEMGELPVPLQVKLLRALQEGEVRRVGDNQSRPVDVRVVVATSRDLQAEVAAGRFRADLYYRVNVVRLHLPPLRDRREDVPELVRHFIGRFNARLGLAVQGTTPAAMERLLAYTWPGNVRELENVVERAMVLADRATIDVEQLPSALRALGLRDGAMAGALAAGVPVSFGGMLTPIGAPSVVIGGDGMAPPLGDDDLSVKRQTAALEALLIARALERTQGNRTRAAQLLDLSPRALLYKIREYGLED